MIGRPGYVFGDRQRDNANEEKSPDPYISLTWVTETQPQSTFDICIILFLCLCNLHDHHQEDQPVRFISIARDFPIALVSLWVPPPPGMVPDVRDYLYDGVGDYDDDGDASSTMLVTGDSSSG